MRRELISNALKERFGEVCSERIPRLSTAAGVHANFVGNVRTRLSNISPEEARDLVQHPRGLDRWTTSKMGCRDSLMALSLGATLDLHETEHPAVHPFMNLLRTSRADTARSCALLIERYSSPLSFTLPEEAEVREYVLARLMTQDRARIEKQGAFDRDELLLKLNLTAVAAARTSDLRFLDALNYYYELLPAWSSSTVQTDALLASYLALYAQALAARM